jgi:ketosteroid isomerase-like protein
MPSEASARQLAESWLAAWNRQDVDAILAHYAQDVEYVSPLAANFTHNGSGVIEGRDALRAYFVRTLGAYPDLHFELEEVFAGVASMTVIYRSVNARRIAEAMELGADGVATRVLVHYARS